MSERLARKIHRCLSYGVVVLRLTLRRCAESGPSGVGASRSRQLGTSNTPSRFTSSSTFANLLKLLLLRIDHEIIFLLFLIYAIDTFTIL
jgi:hypothetical protein